MRGVQLKLLKNESKSYGGELLKTRKGRLRGRPLDTKNSMHLVLRSSKAKNEWSFKRPQNEKKVLKILSKFSLRYGVRVLSLANVGNHLHLQIKLQSRLSYKPFIKALTGSIAMAITGKTRWTSASSASKSKLKFWDYRPFTRVIHGLRAFLTLRDYIEINKLEGQGYKKDEARLILKNRNLEQFSSA